jgi:hypothetical protein
MAPQVLGVTRRSPFVLMVLQALLMQRCATTTVKVILSWEVASLIFWGIWSLRFAKHHNIIAKDSINCVSSQINNFWHTLVLTQLLCMNPCFSFFWKMCQYVDGLKHAKIKECSRYDLTSKEFERCLWWIKALVDSESGTTWAYRRK